MTKVLTDSVEETYKQIFGSTLQEPDQKRIKFLRSVITGSVDYEGKDMALDDAVASTEMDIEDLVDKIKAAKKEEKAELQGEAEGCEDILNVYDTIGEMRKWYLQAETTSKQEAKACVVQPLITANMGYVLETLEDCMEVLHKYRIQELVKTFDNVFNVKGKYKDKAILTVAESLLQKKVPELDEAVLTRMASYHKHLKDLLENAIKNGHERAIDRALKRIEDSGAPELKEYAQEKMNVYKVA